MYCIKIFRSLWENLININTHKGKTPLLKEVKISELITIMSSENLLRHSEQCKKGDFFNLGRK